MLFYEQRKKSGNRETSTFLKVCKYGLLLLGWFFAVTHDALV